MYRDHEAHQKLDALKAQLDRIERRQIASAKREEIDMATLQDQIQALVNEVNNQTSVAAGFLAFINKAVPLLQQANNGANPQIDAILASLQANDATFATALQQGTAALPATPPAPPPTVVPAPATPAAPATP